MPSPADDALRTHAAPSRTDRFSVFSLVLIVIPTALITWYAVVVWLTLYVSPDATVYIPGKYGGGDAGVVLAVSLATPIVILGMWGSITIAMAAVPALRRRRLGGATFLAVTSVVLGMICLGAAVLSADPGMIYAICGSFAVISLLILLMTLQSRRSAEPASDADATGRA